MTPAKTRIFYTALSVVAVLSLAWKPIVVLTWRATHQNSIDLGEKHSTIPFPWIATSSGDHAKAKSFVTLWPNFSREEMTAILENTPPEQRAISDSVWLSERAAKFSIAGYSRIHSQEFGGKVLCSEASRGGDDVAYCRTDRNVNLIYSGPLAKLTNAIKLVSTD
jgi:hypothetical protein